MEDVTYETPEFEERQKLELRINSEPLRGKYSTFIKEIVASHLMVEVPSVEGLYLPVKVGRPVLVEYRRVSARYQFESRVTERDDDSDPPLLAIKRPSRVKRIQKRDFVRVPCSIEARLFVDEDLEDPDLPTKINGEILDLSAGGLKFKTNVPLPVSSRVSFQFELPLVNREIDNLYGYILRREWDEVNQFYFLAVQFEGVLEEQKSALIQYTYRRQLKLNKSS